MCKKIKFTNQNGLTLLELLIALALGVFLLAGILQVFIGSKRSFEVINAQAVMQEAGRFGMGFLGSSIREAGYINAGDIDPVNGDDFASELINIVDGSDLYDELWPAENTFEAGALVSGQEPAFLTNVDTISFRMQGDTYGTMRDCEGKIIGSGINDRIYMTYFIDGQEQLVCNTISGAGVSTAVLVSGVEVMQALYGVADPTPPSRAIKYLNASDMSVDDWKNVISVRVGLLTVSDNAPLDTASQNFDLLDLNLDTDADGRARQIFTQTITLRNRVYD